VNREVNFGGPGGFGGMGGMGALGGAMTMMNGRGGIMDMATRWLGLTAEDVNPVKRVEQLPLGAARRNILQVPVGGVDNPGGSGQGWKMEAIFKLTEEQQKSLEGVRTEYEFEQKKLDAEIDTELKAIAEKVKLLRTKYEQRANDVLAGDDKANKEKMDALGTETATKNNSVVTETMPLFDQNDMGQRFAMLKMLNEKSGANIHDYETRLVELLPANSKERIVEVLDQQSKMREQRNRMVEMMTQGGGAPQWRGRGENGAPGGPDGRGEPKRRDGNHEAVKPPRPPEEEQKRDF
jgi:hypothetical protein